MRRSDHSKTVYIESYKNEVDPFLLSGAAVVYLTLLIWVIGLKYNSSWLPSLGAEMRSHTIMSRINLKPLITNYRGLIHFLANILIYIPMGVLLQTIFPRKSWDRLNCLIVFLTSLVFELSQLFTGFGGCDILDLISNTLGGYIGILFYTYNKEITTAKKINIVQSTVIVLFLPIAIYAVVNTMKHWYLYII